VALVGREIVELPGRTAAAIAPDLSAVAGIAAAILRGHIRRRTVGCVVICGPARDGEQPKAEQRDVRGLSNHFYNLSGCGERRFP
jgi:hypothetical protein